MKRSRHNIEQEFQNDNLSVKKLRNYTHTKFNFIVLVIITNFESFFECNYKRYLLFNIYYSEVLKFAMIVWKVVQYTSAKVSRKEKFDNVY